MDQKVALITGANRGIGFETARQLSEAGFQVILTARDARKGQEAAQKLQADFKALDVASLKSIQQLAAALKEDKIRLEVLIHNAGILLHEHTALLAVEPEAVEQTMHTNALGPLYLTQALQDSLQPQAQVVMVSSGAGEMCGDYSAYAPLYSASKTLLNALTRHLADAFQGRNIYVNAICPGWVRTDMGGRQASRSVEKGAETIVWLAQGGAGKKTGCFFRDKREIHW